MSFTRFGITRFAGSARLFCSANLGTYGLRQPHVASISESLTSASFAAANKLTPNAAVFIDGKPYSKNQLVEKCQFLTTGLDMVGESLKRRTPGCQTAQPNISDIDKLIAAMNSNNISFTSDLSKMTEALGLCHDPRCKKLIDVIIDYVGEISRRVHPDRSSKVGNIYTA